MKSLVAAGAGCVALLALTTVDRPEGTTPSGASREVASSAPVTATSYDLSFVSGAADPVLGSVTRANRRVGHPVLKPAARTMTAAALGEVVKKTCAGCHSDQRRQGNLSLQNLDLATIGQTAPEVAEKMINKLRTGMMPPPGRAKPGGDTLQILLESIERTMDARYAADPNPGTRTFQRLNRAEYERAVKDVLSLDIRADSWLPLDTKSANFDNIADVQLPSATLLDSYLDAASEIARLAVGDPKASVSTSTFKIARLASQLDQVEGAPIGTRGGAAVTHTFPADGEYVFTITLHAIPTGQLFASTAPFDEKIEVSVNGERVALLDIDRGMSQADPQGMEIRTKPVPIRAGPQRIAATFVRTFEGPVNDNITPLGHSIADTQIGAQAGITVQAHIQNFAVTGPYNPTGVSDTPTRRRIFSCRPLSATEARPCAEKILTRLGAQAYRRPMQANDLKGLLAFYDEGAKAGGFEIGIRTALEAMLSSPHFIFRIEEVPAAAKGRVPVSGVDLASRLSFFLWGAPPDSQLVALGRSGRLADTTVLVAQARRLLADPRSEALATRFASQWLRLQDIELVHPDANQFPDFREQLAREMRRETELFFHHLVRENRSLLDLFTANYTYLNESLARHYDIPGVVGNDFRRVTYPAGSPRSGILGHGSVLTLTSVANRTSPVLRGKWVMEVLMGSPPPPPPPNVPDLEETKGAQEGRLLTTRERMEIHRANATCKSCHQFIDPIGLALDNFDVMGRWRIRENGSALDTRGDYYDGTRITNPTELQQALLKRPVPLMRSFTQNLMAYALGRRVEWYDAPTVRRIEAAAGKNNYKINDFILGVVKSDAFRLRKVVAEGPVKAAPTTTAPAAPVTPASKVPAAGRGR
ncbi:DUF1592 domain-containing protein [Gemmatimonas sp.]|jgi:hypothetical protein|uniref:DUF1592 domain-containing protein n=1 Tax=Gemmatimonas sp. TaxID=1962908 RepID=UPI0022C8632C|nr:DUF1592 domain-containing protein [Gemmatimonas sp.]MCZ8012074.1 DUF1592 domain-containing protein [Gemmatimonas sp.]MCZ8267394.1 DUF1592 domain-containing protein [Gemmatimonas sp.]